MNLADVNSQKELLVEAWCDRRAFKPLSIVLPRWPHSGHSDQVLDLRRALRHARAMAKQDMKETELRMVGEIITAIDIAYGDKIDK
ncbi:MAG: hypothetical protein AAGF84_10015 [Planctomycetota bacterium]